MESAVVGRKRTKEPDPNRKAVVLNLKGSPEWKQWIDEGAEHCMTDVAKMIDAAVTQYLKAQGFPKPRPKR